MDPTRFKSILKYIYNSKAYKKAHYKPSYAKRLATGKVTWSTIEYVGSIAEKDQATYNLLMQLAGYSNSYADRRWAKFHKGKDRRLAKELNKWIVVGDRLTKGQTIPATEGIALQKRNVFTEQVYSKIQQEASKKRILIEPAQSVFYADNTARFYFELENTKPFFAGDKEEIEKESTKAWKFGQSMIAYLHWGRWFVGLVLSYDVLEPIDEEGKYVKVGSGFFSTPFTGHNIRAEQALDFFKVDVLNMFKAEGHEYNKEGEFKSEKSGNIYVITGVYLVIHGSKGEKK